MINEAKEREDMLAYLKSIGCGYGGGELDNNPMFKADLDLWLARAQLAAEDAEKWLPIESAPKDGTCVLVYYLNGSGKGRRAHAQYIPRFTEESYEDFAEYCEEKDVYYTPEGWYEICESWDDYSSMKLIYEPTHWRHLPPQPAEREKRARERASIHARHGSRRRSVGATEAAFKGSNQARACLDKQRAQ